MSLIFVMIETRTQYPNRMRRRWPLFWLLLILLWVQPVAQAREVHQGRNCTVGVDDVVVGNLFVMCENLTIEGVVRGSVFGMTVRGAISGTVEGSVYIASTDLNITGNVLGDVHFGGVSLNWQTPLETSSNLVPAEEREQTPLRTSNVVALGLSVTVDEDAVLPGSIVNMGYQLIVNGAVRDEINFWGSTLQIDGPVTGDVYATVGDPYTSNSSVETLLLPFNFNVTLADPGLTITDSGRIVGSLEYHSPAPGRIEGTIDGTEMYVAPQNALPTLNEPATITNYIRSAFQEATSLLVVGAIALLLVPNSIHTPLYRIRRRPFASLSVGLLSFIISFPVVLIVVSLSLLLVGLLLLVRLDAIALLVAVVLGVINIGGATSFYLLAIFVARALFALALGRFIARLFWARDGLYINPYVALLIGVILLALMVTLPAVGWVVNALALFLGLGGILTVVLERFQRMRGVEEEPQIQQYPVSSAVMRPRPKPGDSPQQAPSTDSPPSGLKPPQKSQETPAARQPVEPYYKLPGMSNLPEGFDISFFIEDEEK